MKKQVFHTVEYICPHCKAPLKRRILEIPEGVSISESRFWCPICQYPVSMSLRMTNGQMVVTDVWEHET